MDSEGRGTRFRTFLLGSVLGAFAAAETARRRRNVARRRRERLHTPAGLAAFEGAPCYRELLEDTARTRHSTAERDA
jgi:hypothetical protein